MRVRLTRKLAQAVDGVDLRDCAVGDIIEVSGEQGALLIAEEWAEFLDAPADAAVLNPRGMTRHLSPAIASTVDAAQDQSRIPRSTKHLREVREQMERKARTEHELRRAEDRIREELRDSRARTIRKHR
jgi:hypothetical protein